MPNPRSPDAAAQQPLFFPEPATATAHVPRPAAEIREPCQEAVPRPARGRHHPRRAPLLPELRPRRRMLAAGPRALSAAELLGVLLAGAGGDERRALELAGEVLSRTGGLAGLVDASYGDLSAVVGTGRASALLAAIELGVRLHVARWPERPTISSPRDVHELLGPRLRVLDREAFVVVLVDVKNRVIATPTVAVGTLSSCLVHPREVFKCAIRAGAASIILAHNHPSGDTQPSAEDRTVTRRLVEVGETIGIEVLDHVIVGDGFLSLKEHGLL